MAKTGVKLTPREVGEATTEQLRFLLKSSRDFDGGDRSEAKRLATSLRILLHASRTSHSLLFQLKATHWRFKDTAHPFSPQNLLTHTGLVLMQAGPHGSIFAPLLNTMGLGARTTAFADWWGVDTVVSNTAKARFTRKNIVTWIANQDGGAHVDPEVDPDYYGLTRSGSHGWGSVVDGVKTKMPGVLDASTRQIAHETLLTFRRKMPNLFPHNVYPMYDVITSA